MARGGGSILGSSAASNPPCSSISSSNRRSEKIVLCSKRITLGDAGMMSERNLQGFNYMWMGFDCRSIQGL